MITAFEAFLILLFSYSANNLNCSFTRIRLIKASCCKSAATVAVKIEKFPIIHSNLALCKVTATCN